MGALQKELEEQRALKALKNEYEQIAREINAHESQEALLAKIGQVRREMQELDSRSKSEEIELKQKQLHALVSLIHDLMGEH